MIDYRATIQSIVNQSNGLRAVELGLKVIDECNPVVFEPEEFHQALDQLVREHEIEELEYILPHMNYRIKSIYFPKGTVLGRISELVNK